MIYQNKRERIYLSSQIKENYGSISKSFEELALEYSLEVKYLENTKDIWLRDFMPIQIESGKFVFYNYQPNYLKAEEYVHLKTNPRDVFPKELSNLEIKYSDLILDGGNFVRYKNKAILTDKIYSENKQLTKNEIHRKIYEDFEIDDLIIIPKQPYCRYGHSDSMVRWLNGGTVLVNDFSNEKPEYREKLFNSLEKAKLDIKLMKYEDYFNLEKRKWGAYLNLLKFDNVIIVPTYGKCDSLNAYKVLNECFEDCEIQLVNCSDTIKKGGALHCISWNIQV